MSETKVDSQQSPDGEVRDLDAMIEKLKDQNEKFRHQLFSAREKCAKWKRRYYEEKNKR